jgi:hypothetical protein
MIDELKVQKESMDWQPTDFSGVTPVLCPPPQ